MFGLVELILESKILMGDLTEPLLCNFIFLFIFFFSGRRRDNAGMEIKIESVVPLFNIRGGASFAPRQSEKGLLAVRKLTQTKGHGLKKKTTG